MDHQHQYLNPNDEVDQLRGIARCRIAGCDDVVDLVIGQNSPPGSIQVTRVEGKFVCDPVSRRIVRRITPLLPPVPVRQNQGLTPLPSYKQYVGCRISREDWSWLVEQSTSTGGRIDAITTRLLAEAIDAARARTESPVPVAVG
ncbi:MAG TPA: hypothetical protein VMV09_04660 [Candidatus Saccharimonadales bacterium]|nr:hypothetical protein [Candidatus Saccharimonadales bacterium]